MVHISLKEIVDTHRALADPMRVLILRLLMERELCVCELVAVLAEPQYKVSRHLAVLKDAGLVAEWREGTWIHHEIAPSLSPAWRQALTHLGHVWDASAAIREALARLPGQVTRCPGAACGDLPCAPRTRRTRPNCGSGPSSAMDHVEGER